MIDVTDLEIIFDKNSICGHCHAFDRNITPYWKSVMEYYCIMIFTGEEEKFKERATEILKAKYPSVRFYYFQRKMYTEKRGWFLGTLFSGYLFFQIEELTADFFTELRAIKGFCRILRDNQNPTRITGSALEELKFLIHNGEVLGVSKVQFLPNQKIKALAGPFVGYEGNIVKVNKKQKRITVRSSLVNNSLSFDLKYEELE